jgi:hypothetical protein
MNINEDCQMNFLCGPIDLGKCQLRTTDWLMQSDENIIHAHGPLGYN